MKRRLRKKKRVGEFQELGFEVTYRLSGNPQQEGLEAFLWQFLEHAIEANGLLAGGGGGNPASLFVVSEVNRASATDEQREKVRSWLASRPEVVDFDVRPLRDAWHGWDD